MFANTPEPPYYAVIFTTVKSSDLEGYAEMNAAMFELAKQQEGYLGIESASSNGLGISVTYWRSEEDIARWKNDSRHLAAQRKGYEQWYDAFFTRVCRVERDHRFERGNLV